MAGAREASRLHVAHSAQIFGSWEAKVCRVRRGGATSRDARPRDCRAWELSGI